MTDQTKKFDPWAVYGGLGSELVSLLKKDLQETKCCSLVVLPGALTRLSIARLVNEAVEKRVAEEREACAKLCEGESELVRASANNAREWDASRRSCAKAIRARGEA